MQEVNAEYAEQSKTRTIVEVDIYAEIIFPGV